MTTDDNTPKRGSFAQGVAGLLIGTVFAAIGCGLVLFTGLSVARVVSDAGEWYHYVWLVIVGSGVFCLLANNMR